MKWAEMDELCRAWLITFAGISITGLIVAFILRSPVIAFADIVVFVPIEAFVLLLAWLDR